MQMSTAGRWSHLNPGGVSPILDPGGVVPSMDSGVI